MSWLDAFGANVWSYHGSDLKQPPSSTVDLSGTVTGRQVVTRRRSTEKQQLWKSWRTGASESNRDETENWCGADKMAAGFYNMISIIKWTYVNAAKVSRITTRQLTESDRDINSHTFCQKMQIKINNLSRSLLQKIKYMHLLKLRDIRRTDTAFCFSAEYMKNYRDFPESTSAALLRNNQTGMTGESVRECINQCTSVDQSDQWMFAFISLKQLPLNPGKLKGPARLIIHKPHYLTSCE